MALTRRAVVKAGGGLCLASAFAWLLDERSHSYALGDELRRDKQRLLDLPDGFSYKILDTSGNLMSDGFKVPGAPDGMGCFVGPDGSLILMRNHELAPEARREGPYTIRRPYRDLAYDKKAQGGVSRVVLNPQTLEVLSHNMVLIGTTRNCAGGLSPWGWLSCEETVEENHGYVFLCNPFADSVAAPQIIRSYGRFNHEAATVEPKTLIAYLTEDRGDSCFYRFFPDNRANPFKGRLQALAVKGERGGFETSRYMSPGDTVEVSWVDIGDGDLPQDTLRAKAQELGAAAIRRGEGLWLDGDKVYFSATNGGSENRGQIFCYKPSEETQEGTLTVVAEGTADNRMNFPDNLAVAPWGDLVVAEDNEGKHQYIRIVKPDGRIKTLAYNARSSGEFAGVCFAPSGKTLFVNMQNDGVTVAISGPFKEWCAGFDSN